MPPPNPTPIVFPPGGVENPPLVGAGAVGAEDFFIPISHRSRFTTVGSDS